MQKLLKKFLQNSPWLFFHAPTAPYILYLGLKARNLLFFTYTNPCMIEGKAIRMAKSRILSHIDDEFRPNMLKVKSKDPFELLQSQFREVGLTYPVVAKPDYSERGFGVEKIQNDTELASYHTRMNGQYIIQEFLEDPYELGVLYYRFPEEERGQIYSVSVKDLLSVTGDGVSTLEALMDKDPKRNYMKSQKKKFQDRLNTVPAKGEKIVINFIGQHLVGAQFNDSRYLITDELVASFDRICKKIPGFHYGRFDLKASDLDQFKAGKGFKFLELNGTASIPIHIWDPDISVWEAYRTIFYHWKLVYEIAMQNMRLGRTGVSYKEAFAGLKARFSRNEQIVPE